LNSLDQSAEAELEFDFASLARLAAAESYEDIRLLLARLVRKYRQSRPDLAAQLDASLRTTRARSGKASVLRRNEDMHRRSGVDDDAPTDRESGLALLREFDDREGMPPPFLHPSLLKEVESIVRERKEVDRLLERGIRPTRSAILVGPPGVGKTLSARWIASLLGRPLWVLDLTAVMSSLLGKTGSNLRAAFDHAKAHAAVLLLDEIDAIAKRRNDETDVGELKRLVTVILQEVDHWPDTGLLLAATNHPELIDRALWRRFDAVLSFEPPDRQATRLAVARFLGSEAKAFEPWLEALVFSMKGLSLSDVERTLTRLRRRFALETASAEQLVRELLEANREPPSRHERLSLAVALASAGELSHTEISRQTGVSRDTIRKHAGPSPRQGRGLK
jgi:ATPase family protein associated with various cellular activities (AAA)